MHAQPNRDYFLLVVNFILAQGAFHGISQETLARAADLKLSNLAKLEGGFNFNPTLNTLTAIANVLTEGSIDKLLR